MMGTWIWWCDEDPDAGPESQVEVKGGMPGVQLAESCDLVST